MEARTVFLRAKSTGPARRGGLLLTPIGTWVVHELTVVAGDFLRTLLALVEDPQTDVQVSTGPDSDGKHDWEPVPTAEELKAGIAALEDDAGRVLEAAASEIVNTLMPTAEPTLERAGDPDTQAAAEGNAGQASVEAAAATAEMQNASTATHTDAPTARERDYGAFERVGEAAERPDTVATPIATAKPAAAPKPGGRGHKPKP